MLTNKSITGTLIIERTDELKTMEKIFLSEEKFIRKYKRNKWLLLFVDTFLAYLIAELCIDVSESIQSMIITVIFASVFSYVMYEWLNLNFIKFICSNNINININNFSSNTCVAFRDKLSNIINSEMDKENIKEFNAHLESVLTTPENYQVDITYTI